MSARDSAGPRRRALLCGYYGEHNIGDDALLQVLLQQLPEGWQPLVTAHDRKQVGDRFRVETVERRRLAAVLRALAGCDALVLGGGSLLQDSTSFRSLLYYGALILSARSRGKPVLLWGQGLGPLRRRRSRLIARLLLAQARAISWRDPASARLAAGWGITASVGSDPVWSLPRGHWRGGEGPLLLCWRQVEQLEAGGWPPLLQALDVLAERLDRPVHWLPFHREQDSGLLEHLQARGLVPERLLRRSRSVAASDPEQAMALFGGASLVLAMRLHGLVLAALAGSPCVALSYDPKVAAAAQALGCPCHDLALPPPPELVDQWQLQLQRPPEPAALARLAQQAQVHRDLLRRLDG